VRVATSKAAQQRLGSQRVRRLLAIELEDEAVVAAAANGTLAGDIIRIWIDVPSSRRARIEVRRGERSVARRTLAISDFPADVAARVVAIATSEMVRVQARVQPRPTPRDAHAERAAEGAKATFAVGGALSALILPSSSPAFGLGPELSLSHQIGLTSQTLYGRWLFGESGDRHLRWLEIGAAAGVRLPLGPAWRLHLAAKAGGVSLALPQADADEARSDWTVRAGGLIGVEAELAPRTWLGVSLEPGALLRSNDLEDTAGRHTELGGFALGLGVGLVASP
jgi:hypothetical protein